jgi:peptidoglycan/LPS O-acetylase OafA/YrhL
MFAWLGTRLPRENNFDLIRLFAASQVLLTHSIIHFGAAFPAGFRSLLFMFPGVPIFFFISGLLVTSSLAGRDLKPYAEARVRRVFPALWLAFGIALLILMAFSQITATEARSPNFWAWVATQVTVFQVYNPAMFNDFGVGVVNGSLWTIPVEIGFYFILPLLVYVSRRSVNLLTWVLGISVVLSFVFDQWLDTFGPEPALIFKIAGATPLPHMWLFASGALTFLHFEKVRSLLGRFQWWVPMVAYIAFRLVAAPVLAEPLAAAVSGVLMFLAIMGVAIIAPTRVHVLRGNDISYGIYVYHMLVVNGLVEMGMGGWLGVAIALVVTTSLAWFSWMLLERRVLKSGQKQREPAS